MHEGWGFVLNQTYWLHSHVGGTSWLLSFVRCTLLELLCCNDCNCACSGFHLAVIGSHHSVVSKNILGENPGHVSDWLSKAFRNIDSGIPYYGPFEQKGPKKRKCGPSLFPSCRWRFLLVFISNCCVVDCVFLAAVSLQRTVGFTVSLSVASFFSHFLHVVLGDFLAVRIYDGFHVLAAAIGNFYCIPVEYSVQGVVSWKMFCLSILGILLRLFWLQSSMGGWTKLRFSFSLFFSLSLQVNRFPSCEYPLSFKAFR